MTSGDGTNVARCNYCGREFDVRRFQVRLGGRRGVYDSTECAEAHVAAELPRVVRMRGGEPRGRLK